MFRREPCGFVQEAPDVENPSSSGLCFGADNQDRLPPNLLVENPSSSGLCFGGRPPPCPSRPRSGRKPLFVGAMFRRQKCDYPGRRAIGSKTPLRRGYVSEAGQQGGGVYVTSRKPLFVGAMFRREEKQDSWYKGIRRKPLFVGAMFRRRLHQYGGKPQSRSKTPLRRGYVSESQLVSRAGPPPGRHFRQTIQALCPTDTLTLLSLPPSCPTIWDNGKIAKLRPKIVHFRAR